MAKKHQSRFKRPGGIIALPREMIRSPTYHALGLPARNLIPILQDVWNPSEGAIHYSVERAATALKVSKGTASKAFKELWEHGFLQCVNESDWMNGKAREWRLTWMEFQGREPTDEWAHWQEKITSSVSEAERSTPNPFSMKNGQDSTVHIEKRSQRKINDLRTLLEA